MAGILNALGKPPCNNIIWCLGIVCKVCKMYLENTVGSKVITVNVVDTGVKQDLVPPCATVGTLPPDPNHRPPACPQQPQVVGLVLLGPL